MEVANAIGLSADPKWLPETRFGAQSRSENSRIGVEFRMQELLAFAGSATS